MGLYTSEGGNRVSGPVHIWGGGGGRGQGMYTGLFVLFAIGAQL